MQTGLETCHHMMGALQSMGDALLSAIYHDARSSDDQTPLF